MIQHENIAVLVAVLVAVLAVASLVWVVKYGTRHYEQLYRMGVEHAEKEPAQRRSEVENGGPRTGMAEILLRLLDIQAVVSEDHQRIAALEDWRSTFSRPLP